MLNPGDFSLCDLALTAALTGQAQTAVENLEGMQACTILCRYAFGAGGTSAKAWVQVTLDDGQTWIDVACFAFAGASGTKVINLSGLTPVDTAITPSDGAMADNAVLDGILGSAIRVKATTTGVHSNSVLSVKLSAR